MEKKTRSGRGKKSEVVGNVRFSPEHDLPILLALADHRILRTSHLSRLTKRSQAAINGRLLRLRTAGYTDSIKPKNEKHHKVNPENLHALGDLGVDVVSDYYGTRRRKSVYSQLNKDIGQDKVSHLLLINDFLVDIQEACHNSGGEVRYISEREILTPVEKRFNSTDPLLLSVNVKGKRMTTRPDLLFGLEFLTRIGDSGKPLRAYFFGEADRGTITQSRRRNDEWTSNHKKYVVYYHWGREIYQAKKQNRKLDESEFFLKNFRVLFFTSKGELRARNLRDYLLSIEETGKEQWLFQSYANLQESESILNAEWLTGKGGSTSLVG
jgi:hypothetical protein